MNLKVGGPGLALAGGDDSHRDLAPVSIGDALNGPRFGGPAGQHGPGLLQAIGGCRVGLRLITGRRLGGGVESATFLDVSGRAPVDQMRQAEFHDVLPSGGRAFRELEVRAWPTSRWASRVSTVSATHVEQNRADIA
jgi:hypothetical protein